MVEIAALQNLESAYVGCGSKADKASCLEFVRFTPESGHGSARRECPPCAKSGHNAVQQISTGFSSIFAVFG